MSVLGVLQLVALAGLSFAALAGLLVSVVTPSLLAAVRGWAPRPRHQALVVIAIAPVLLALACTLASLVPSLLPLLWPEQDHCLAHDDGHLHMCAVHLPHRLGNGLSWLVLVLGSCWCAAKAIAGATKVRRAARIAAGLLAYGRRDVPTGAVVLATETPLCVLVGVLRPVVVLSEGLVAGLPAPSLLAVLRHEQAHARRRDTLVRLVARVSTLFVLPSVRARLLEALELAAEQSCDEAAAASLGRMSVADAILRVERMLAAHVTGLRPVAEFFGGHAVPQRIHALLEEPRRQGHAGAFAAALALVVALALAASKPLHHSIESLLGVLVH
jgi:Zn-dependent protease with chaperone function